MRILSAIRYDIKFQIRHGFYYAYLLLTVFYIIALKLIPENYRGFAAILIIFTDPSVLGFYFIGGIVLMERGQNTLESLFVTPFKVSEYMWSKVVSLTLLSFVSSLAIAFFSLGIKFNLTWFFFGVVLSSAFFSLIGFALAVRAKNLNHYFFLSFFTFILILPMMEYLGLGENLVYYLLPAKPVLLLLFGSINEISVGEAVYSISALIAWIGIAYLWAYRWFYKYIILKIGGSRR